ncbi:MAG: hypothetical protein MJZ34_07210 [Paludibacteraceae bacterium]|nr:hypothetical protein [Paludibacteraceae bacterium]
MKKVLLTEREYLKVCAILNEKTKEIDEKKEKVIDAIIKSYNDIKVNGYRNSIYSELYENFLYEFGVKIFDDNKITIVGNVLNVIYKNSSSPYESSFRKFKSNVKSHFKDFKFSKCFKYVEEQYYKNNKNDERELIKDLRADNYTSYGYSAEVKCELYLDKIPSEIVDKYYEKFVNIEAKYDDTLNSIDFSSIKIPDRDWVKMIAYKKKQSDEKVLVNSIKDDTKLLNRFLIASIIGWNEFSKLAAEKLGLDIYKLNAYKNEFISSGKVPDKYLEEFNASKEGKYAFDYRYMTTKIKNAILNNENIVDIREIKEDKKYTNLEPDKRNGICWTITLAYELTLSNGNTVSFQYDDHTSERIEGPSYGYEWGHSSIPVGWTKEFDTQDSIIKLINKLVEEGMK